jgi:hypothetical protein
MIPDGSAVGTIKRHAKAQVAPDNVTTAPPNAPSMPEEERWLHEDPAAMAQFKEGVRQVERGEVVSLGSFAQYLDSES